MKEKGGGGGDSVCELGDEKEERVRETGHGEQGGQGLEEAEKLLVLDVFHVAGEEAEHEDHSLQLAERRRCAEAQVDAVQDDIQRVLLVGVVAQFGYHSLPLSATHSPHPDSLAQRLRLRGRRLLQEVPRQRHIREQRRQTHLEIRRGVKTHLVLGEQRRVGAGRDAVAQNGFKKGQNSVKHDVVAVVHQTNQQIERVFDDALWRGTVFLEARLDQAAQHGNHRGEHRRVGMLLEGVQ